MPTEAWATGGRAHGAMGLDEDLHQPFAHRVQIDLLAAGDDDGSNSWVDLPPAEHGRRRAQILPVAIGAHADHHLIDLQPRDLRDGLDVLWQERHGDEGLELGDMGFLWVK